MTNIGYYDDWSYDELLQARNNLLETYDEASSQLDYETALDIGLHIDEIEEAMIYKIDTGNSKRTFKNPVFETSNKPVYKSCKHTLTPLIIDSNGGTVYCSSIYAVDENRKIDFGLYAEERWFSETVSRNEFINWPDFKAPAHPEVAYRQILEAWYAINDGDIVEIGCMGGHGRTGTIAAALCIIANLGLRVTDAVQYVRDNYCTSAVESNVQIEFLEYVYRKTNLE